MLFRRAKLTWALSLLGLPLCAQPKSAPIVVDRATVHQARSRTIPADLLRYPLSARARSMLQKALQISESGDHPGAVEQLQRTLAKCPDSAAYAHSLIGVEYLKTDQIPQATDALEQAVKLLPHDASNHANLGLSLVLARQYDRAEPELRRALELDPQNTTASRVLTALALNNTASK
jgi:Flp pilus assembly protein TadD